MGEIFSEAATVQAWISVERALINAQVRVGDIAEDAAAPMLLALERVVIDLPALWRDSQNVGYPILPLVRQLAQGLPEDGLEQIHLGATTQDIMDSGLALQLCAALDHLIVLTRRFGDALSALVREHRLTPMAGRTHAQHAVPITFGAKIAVYLSQLADMIEALHAVKRAACRVSLFGAAGNSSALGPHAAIIREFVAQELGLSDAAVPWHVARNRLVDVVERSTQLATVAGRFAREIVDLSRTEIREVSEQDGHLRGASSTMPQKSNPISCEAVIGMVAILQSLSPAAHRMAEAGHERAAGEWQIEWYVMPESMCLAASAVTVAGDIAANLVVSPETMERNLERNKEIMAEAYMVSLAPRLGRQAAHDLVYAATRASRREAGSLYETLDQLLRETTPQEGLAEIRTDDYLGESSEICELSLRHWADSLADRAIG